MSEPSRTFDADSLRSALDELCERLVDAEVTAGICIVGGAAIALTVAPERVATHDIDVVVYPQSATAAVLDVVAEMAVARGWPNDWLSDAVGTLALARSVTGDRGRFLCSAIMTFRCLVDLEIQPNRRDRRIDVVAGDDAVQ